MVIDRVQLPSFRVSGHPVLADQVSFAGVLLFLYTESCLHPNGAQEVEDRPQLRGYRE